MDPHLDLPVEAEGPRKEQLAVYKSSSAPVGLASRTPLPEVGLSLSVGTCVVGGRRRPGLG